MVFPTATVAIASVAGVAVIGVFIFCASIVYRRASAARHRKSARTDRSSPRPGHARFLATEMDSASASTSYTDSASLTSQSTANSAVPLPLPDSTALVAQPAVPAPAALVFHPNELGVDENSPAQV